MENQSPLNTKIRAKVEKDLAMRLGLMSDQRLALLDMFLDVLAFSSDLSESMDMDTDEAWMGRKEVIDTAYEKLQASFQHSRQGESMEPIYRASLLLSTTSFYFAEKTIQDVAFSDPEPDQEVAAAKS